MPSANDELAKAKQRIAELEKELHSCKGPKEDPLFEGLFEKGPDAIIEFSVDEKDLGRILVANKNAAALHRCSPEQLIGRRVWQDGLTEEGEEHAPETPPSEFFESLSKLRESKSINVERNRRRMDGTIFRVSVHLVETPGWEGRRVLAFFRDISQTEKTTRILHETSRIAKIGGWELDLTTLEPIWSEEVYNIHEVDPSVLPNLEEAINFYAPEYRDTIKKVVKNSIETGNPWDLELEIITAKGNRKWIRTMGHALTHNSKAYKLYGVFQDITGIKEAKIELEDTRFEIQQIFDAMPISLVYTDAERRIVHTNPHFERIFGYKNDEVKGKLTKVLYASNKDYEEQGTTRYYTNNAQKNLNFYELSYVRKSRAEFEAETIGTQIRNKKNEVVGYIDLIRDLTKRKQADNELKQLAARLKSSENTLNSIIESAVDGIITIRSNGIIQSANSATEKIFGYKPAELIGNNISMLMDMPHRNKHDGYLKNHLETGHTAIIGTGREVPAIHKDGSRVDIDLTVSRLEVDGQTLFTGILRDITARKRAEEEKRKLEVQLRQSQRLETIGTLAGGIAHDFNNILTPIIGYTSMALKRMPSEDPLHEDMEIIKSSATRAKRLVRQILDFSRQSEFEQELIDLHILLPEVLELTKATLPDNILLQSTIPDTPIRVEADPTQIHQIVVNICTNAWQAMKQEGGTLSVELDVESRIDQQSQSAVPYARISIVDTGIGMEMETARRIFEPFFTTKDVDEGTGLGLSVVHGIVKENKGEILVHSNPGEGSRFDVFLPLSRKEQEDRTEESIPDSQTGSTILIVDDDPAALRSISRMVESLECTSKPFNDPEEAIWEIKRNHDMYDLVLTDFSMPKVNGLQIAQETKRARKDLPVVIISGYTDDLSQDSSIHSVLNKPIDINELSQAIQPALSSRSQHS